jgi:recombinational DNA repair ATPase RecF
MRCTAIKLIRYERFSLNEFEVFEATFESPLQIILGTNGSGKSSLLEQITPLPPNPSDFSKDGGKVITYEMDGSTYVLSSLFGTPHPHSFFKDGVELNTAGNVTMQRELVKSVFGITPEIHMLLMGNEKFTTMPANRKKDWFIKLCDSDFDYAIRVYNKAREAHRDSVGALKLARNALIAEADKMVSEDVLKDSQRLAEELYRALNNLLLNRMPVEHDLFQLEMSAAQLDARILDFSKQLNVALEKSNAFTRTQEESERLLSELMVEHSRAEGKYQAIAKELSQVKNKLEVLRASGVDDLNNLAIRKKTISDEILAISSSLRFGESSHCSDINSVRSTIREILSEMPDNSDRRYTQQTLTVSRGKLVAITGYIADKEKQLEQIRAALAHYKKHKDNPDQKCPKCEYIYSSGFDKKDYEDLGSEFSNVVSNIEKLKAEKDALTLFCEEADKFATGWRSFHFFKQTHPGLSNFWNYLIEEDFVHDRSKSPDAAFNLILVDLERISVLNERRTQLKAIEELEKTLNGDLNQTESSLTESIERLDSELGKCTSQTVSLKERISAVNSEIGLRKSLNSLNERIRHCIREKKSLGRIAKETIRRQCYNESVALIQRELSEVEARISRYTSQKNRVDQIASDIVRYEQAEKELGLLVKTLSPNDGLIAEGLNGFIVHFVRSMNDFISKIWTYEMEILPCGVQDGEGLELDYKFPIKLPNRSKPIPDVKFGSSGMSEIIDLAWVFLAKHCLKIKNAPMFLDEFGRTFDPAHKNASVGIIKSMIDHKVFEQVFMISHDYHQYGALVNSQIAVLNSLNVAPPSGAVYNEHIRMF